VAWLPGRIKEENRMAITGVLVPAYGRNYKSKAAVQADFNANKDFMLRSFERDGYVTKQELRESGTSTIQVRYGKGLTKTTMLKV
jgi:hypothetical protein